jgi:high-affinity nickel-transport protein
MSELLALAGFGFVLGMRHATDADHVIAVTTILSRTRRFAHSTLIGALWGLGHSITVLVVGMAIIVFGIVIPPGLGLAMELAVAVMLIVLGVLSLTGALRGITERLTPPAPLHGHDHEHRHAHEDTEMHGHEHAHLHGHGTDSALSGLRDLPATVGWYQLGRPVVVGLVHGLAGSAAVALLVLTTISDPSGPRLPRHLLRRGRGRDGHPDHRHRSPIRRQPRPLGADQPLAHGEHGHPVHRLRAVPRLPDRHRRRTVHRRLPLGAGVADSPRRPRPAIGTIPMDLARILFWLHVASALRLRPCPRRRSS